MEPTPRREALLADAVDYVLRRGVADLSLRPLAAELGTSDRMLVYHFGSKGQLVEQVLDRTASVLAAMLLEATGSGDDTPTVRLRRVWRQLSGPEAEPYARLWFEVYGLAVRGLEPYRAVTTRTVRAWLDLSKEILVAGGAPPALAQRLATVEVAAIEGLLLDLLATGDRRRIDRAADDIIAHVTDWA